MSASRSRTVSSRASGQGKFYAVKRGRMPGIYLTWAECEQQVTAFPQPSYKSFILRSDAEDFVAGRPVVHSAASGPPKFYGVASGRITGVYTDWEQVQSQIVGWKGPKFKKFGTKAEAEEFVRTGGVAPLATATPATKRKASKAAIDSTATSSKAGPAKKKTKVEVVPARSMRIYTDGSSLSNGRAGASAGVGVFFGVGDRRNVSEALPGREQTNQRAELTAVLRALEIAPQGSEVEICTDSQYSIDCVTKWYRSWMRNGWLTATKAPVVNRDLIEAVRAKIDAREIAGARTAFTWVKGHSNDPSNAAADRLAVAGAQKARVA